MRKIIPRSLSIVFALTCVCACDQSQVQEPDVVEPVRYKISGIVTLEEDGSPLAGIDVSAFEQIPCFLCSEERFETYDSMRTDRSGWYQLSWTDRRGCTIGPYRNLSLSFHRRDDIWQNYRTGRMLISTRYSAKHQEVECTSEPQTIDAVMKRLLPDTTYYCPNSSGGYWRCPPF